MLASIGTQTWWSETAWQRGTGDALGREAFLRLLVTELKNQNPLDPVDNREFVAQLAQFSALEQMQGVNRRLDEILGAQQAMSEQLAALAAILAAGGRTAAAEG